MWPLYLSRKQAVENAGAPVQQCHEEFSDLIDLLRGRVIRDILEIGAGAGGWAATIAGALGVKVNVLYVDPKPKDRTKGKDLTKALEKTVRRMRQDGHTAEWISEASQDVEKEVRAELRWFDLLHIDGDHGAMACADDFRRYWKLVRPGGMIVFHDVGPVGEPAPGHIFEAVVASTGWRSWRFYYGKGDPKGVGIGVLQTPGQEGAEGA